MWGGSGAACKARGPEDTASRLLPPWVVTSVTWSGLLRSLPITPSASSPGAAHRGRGPAWATQGAARPAATPAPAQGCGKVAPYCSLMVCFVLWLRAHSQPAWPCSGHMALIKTAGHPWSRTAPRCPGGAQECRPTLFSVMSVPQQSANPNQLDTGHCPGGSPGSRTPMGAAVFGTQTGTEGGRKAGGWAPCPPAGGHSTGFLVMPSLRGWRSRPPSASTAWHGTSGLEHWPAWGGRWVCPNVRAGGEPLSTQSSGPVLLGPGGLRFQVIFCTSSGGTQGPGRTSGLVCVHVLTGLPPVACQNKLLG